MNSSDLPSTMSKYATVTMNKLRRSFACLRKQHQPITSDFVLRDILFSDLKRLHEIEENLKSLHVPKKPSNGDEESPVECYKRRVAENQKEAYLEEIARLNKKIYGISLSDESTFGAKDASETGFSLKSRPTRSSGPATISSSYSSPFSSCSSSSSSLTSVSSEDSQIQSNLKRFVPQGKTHDEKEKLLNGAQDKLEILYVINKKLKSQLQNDGMTNNERLKKEMLGLKCTVDVCCAQVYELVDENTKLRSEISNLQRSLEEVSKVRDAYATVLKWDTMDADEEQWVTDKLKLQVAELEREKEELQRKLEKETQSEANKELGCIRQEEMGGGDAEEILGNIFHE